MRRPLAPLPGRPNPTDPGDAADLSIPQGTAVAVEVRVARFATGARLTKAVRCKVRPRPGRPQNDLVTHWNVVAISCTPAAPVRSELRICAMPSQAASGTTRLRPSRLAR